MEVPTYANFFMALLILQGVPRMFSVISLGNREGLPMALLFMTLYSLGSLFNLVHYTIEPPEKYGLFANITIAGTALTTFPILFILGKIYFGVPEGKSDQLLSSGVVDGSGVRASSRKRAPVNRLSY